MHQLDKIETGPTNRAAVGPFHPWCEALIVKIVTTRSKVGNQVVSLFVVEVWGGVVVVLVFDMDAVGGTGSLQLPGRDCGDIDLRRLGKGRRQRCTSHVTIAQVS